MIKKIEDIQTLRGIAIIFVMLEHLNLVNFVTLSTVGFKFQFSEGVRLFFVISGYVIALSFFSKKEIKPLNFVTKRIFRIYPVLLFFLGFSALVNWVFSQAGIQALDPAGSNFYLVQWGEYWELARRTIIGTYITPSIPYKYNALLGAMWSLSIEFQFYAAVTLVGTGLHYLLRRKKKFIEDFIFVGFVLLAIYSFANKIVFLFTGGILVNNALTSYLVWWGFDYLFLGFILAVFHKRGLLDRLNFSTIPKMYVFLLSIALIVGPLVLNTIVQIQSNSGQPYATRIQLGVVYPLSALCYTLLVHLASTVGCFPAKTSRLYRLVYWVGETSYSIYLFHIPIIALASIVSAVLLMTPLSQLVNISIYGPAALELVIVVGALVPFVTLLYFRLEKPMINVGYGLLGKLDPAATTK